MTQWRLQDKRSMHFCDLSGGQRQRLFIARTGGLPNRTGPGPLRVPGRDACAPGRSLQE
jgi:hypothetical protein